jgi:hypothetical protein
LLFHGYCYLLSNTISGRSLPENFGMNERLRGLKPGYLLSGISKKLHLAVNPAGYSPIF